MKSLSMTERQDISKLLDEKLKRRVSELTAQDPLWKERIEEKKQKSALGRLRIEKDMVELKGVEAEISVLKKKASVIEKRIAAKMPKKKQDRYGNEGCPVPMDKCEAVTKLCNEIHDAEMGKDPTGKKVLTAEADHFAAKAALAKCTTREELAKAKIL